MQKAKVMGFENTTSHVSGLGAILLAVGIVWLAKEMGWIPQNIPVWPALLIAVGIVMLVNKARCCKK